MAKPPSDALIQQLGDVLSKLVDERVDQRLAALSAHVTGEGVYRSRGGLLPPGCRTPRSMRDRIQRHGVPHWTEGEATQKTYICRSADWHKAVSRPAKVTALRVVRNEDDEAIAERALAGVVRLTRGQR